MPKLLKLCPEQICITHRPGDTLERDEVLLMGQRYATIFEAPPWSFNWSNLLDQPEHPESCFSFLQRLIGFGAHFFLAENKDNSDVLGFTIVLKLTEEALRSPNFIDLAIHGNAKPGDVYLAGSGLLPEAQGIGIGHRFMQARMDWGGKSVRYVLRTQMDAHPVVALARKFDMKVYKKYPLLQAGRTLDRVLFARDPIG